MKYSSEKWLVQQKFLKKFDSREDSINIIPLSNTISGNIRSAPEQSDPGHIAVNQNGFTLIEIIVVMILAAIAGSLVLMNVGQSGRMKESRMFADKMVAMCRKARLTAVGRGVPACLTISPESRECHIALMDDALLYSRTTEKSSAKNSMTDQSAPDGGSGAFYDDDLLKIPENILVEGERIRVGYGGLYLICFYPDGSSGGGILTLSVENEFEFTFQVDMLTGSIKEVDEAR